MSNVELQLAIELSKAIYVLSCIHPWNTSSIARLFALEEDVVKEVLAMYRTGTEKALQGTELEETLKKAAVENILKAQPGIFVGMAYGDDLLESFRKAMRY